MADRFEARFGIGPERRIGDTAYGETRPRPYPHPAACRLASPSIGPDMSNFSSFLKTEIARVARKEIKSAADPLRKANTKYRRDIADLKRQVSALQKEIRALSKGPRASAPVPAATQSSARFRATGLKSLRARLGLSAADFGRLVGASGQSVYNWEAGKAVPRASQQAALASVRGLGKREAARRLEASA